MSTAGRCFVEFGRDVLPCRPVAMICRKVPYKPAHVGERDNRHHPRDDQRLRQAARPIRSYVARVPAALRILEPLLT
jgi:hypothetical protein